jgi:cellulose synthase/poly-beta-1,6-N-acetylglucosamine synthase-like glycosyltransferase
MTRGVSPKELDAFMIQRMRWAVGAIQIVRAGNPLFTSGLHLKARWLYFFSTVGIVYIIPVVFMGIIMYATILAGAPVSFGPTSFTEYLIIGGTAVGLMMIMQYLAGWRLAFRDYLRALQDNFTVFMTLIRSIMIGFLGFEMGFAVTNKVSNAQPLLLIISLLTMRTRTAIAHQRQTRLHSVVNMLDVVVVLIV